VALANELQDIDYYNFRDSMEDKRLHNAYQSVWWTMAQLQPFQPPFGGGPRSPRNKRMKMMAD
jgi:hypothetical protein